jgi:hypothetical protein
MDITYNHEICGVDSLQILIFPNLSISAQRMVDYRLMAKHHNVGIE